MESHSREVVDRAGGHYGWDWWVWLSLAAVVATVAGHGLLDLSAAQVRCPAGDARQA